MKLIGFLLLVLCLQNAWAQTVKKKKVYTIQISHMDGTNSRGLFYGLADSSLRIATIKKRDTTFQTIAVAEVDRFFVRQKGMIGKCVAIGMLTGSLVGLATYQEPDCEGGFCFDFGPGPPMGAGAVIGGLVGVGVGVGMVKKWKLGGDQELYEKLKPQLTQYCLTCH